MNIKERAYQIASVNMKNKCSPAELEDFAEALVAELAKENKPVYAFRRKGLDYFCTCDERRYKELAQKPTLFEVKVLYTLPPTAGVMIAQMKRIAELEAALKVARDGIDKFLVANDPTEFGCACDMSVDYLCGPCRADKQQEPLKIALAKINAIVSKWWDSGMAALDEYQQLKPGAAESAEAWAKMRKEML